MHSGIALSIKDICAFLASTYKAKSHIGNIHIKIEHSLQHSTTELTSCEVRGHVRPAVGPYKLPIKIIFLCLSVFT